MSAAPRPKPSAFISELVVQGIRRFGEVRRFTLGPGYNVLYGLSAAGKSTLHEVMLSLLFARPAEGEAESFKSLHPQGNAACRAGMSIDLNGETFRILKDYQQGAVSLSRLIPAERRFELVHGQPAQIVRWLETTAGIPAGPSFGRLFTLTREDLPSATQPVAITASRADGADHSIFEERIRNMPLPEKKAMLGTLSEEYRRHAEVKTSEFLQDGMRSKLFEVEALLKKREEARERIAELDLELKKTGKLPKLPEGIDERVEAYRRHEKTKEADLERLLPNQQDAHQALESVIPFPFTEKDMRSLNSPIDMAAALLKKDRAVGGGLAALVAGAIALFFGSTIAYIGVAVMAGGLGTVAYRGLIVFLKGKEKFDQLKKKVDAIDEQVKLVERKWDIETTVVRNLMKAYDVDDPREMKDIEATRDGHAREKTELETMIEGLVLPSGDKDLDGVRARINRQITSIDERLQEMSGKFTTDPKDLEPQIVRLDREVARAEGRKPTPRSRLLGLEDESDDDGDPGRNAIVSMVESWSGSHKVDPGRLLRSVQEAYGHNLRAISGGKFTEGVFDALGSVSVREEGKPSLPFESLDGLAKDAAYLSLRLTLLQLGTVGDNRTITLLDDPFEFEDGRLALLSRAFKALGPAGQVIHLTSKPVHQRLADHQVEI